MLNTSQCLSKRTPHFDTSERAPLVSKNQMLAESDTEIIVNVACSQNFCM